LRLAQLLHLDEEEASVAPPELLDLKEKVETRRFSFFRLHCGQTIVSFSLRTK
jgi:hypothetical protein